MKMKFKKTHQDAITPVRQKPGDSGLDLHACLPEGPVWLVSGASLLIPTGIAIQLPRVLMRAYPCPKGFEAQVRPRSGFAMKGIVAAFGTIDNGYRGDIGVILTNLSNNQHKVSHGDRIAQLVVVPVMYPELEEVTELEETERGASGFGSTGV